MTERLFNAYQVAELLGLTLAEVSSWIQQGDLPFIRLPEGSIRISEHSLNQFLRRQGINIEDLYSRLDPKERMAGHYQVQPAKVKALAAVAANPQATVKEQKKTIRLTSAAAETPPVVAPAADVAIQQVSQPDEAPPAAVAAQVADAILTDAIVRRAQEIVLDLKGQELSLRLRIDGHLHDKTFFRLRLPPNLGKELLEHLASLAKIQTGHALASGQFFRSIAGQQLQVKIFSSPTIQGQRMVIQLPLQQGQSGTLRELGMAPADELLLGRMARQEGGGLVLVCGPEPAARAATIQTLINDRLSAGSDVAAMVNGPASRFAGISELPLDARGTALAGDIVKFLAAQHCDVVVLDEITELAAARLAMDAASAGALVLAGMSCTGLREAFGALVSSQRGLWSLAANLRAIITQRSVRRLCKCRQEVPLDLELLDRLGLAAPTTTIIAYRFVGCQDCGRTGFTGRTNLYGVLVSSQQLRTALRSEQQDLIDKALSTSFSNCLSNRALCAINEGLTTPEELLKAGPLM